MPIYVYIYFDELSTFTAMYTAWNLDDAMRSVVSKLLREEDLFSLHPRITISFGIEVTRQRQDTSCTMVRLDKTV